ncbi:hypothetical protein Cgig2_033022 [Carnegiea gigantea]|uniref:Uncharacterized protein n=1 Tax=Carnegiea gigantea TaxID=171969 RepID=A0A9Q1K7C0_9CARY|nr:hypothetical protein Cgig2_033022 [Carnegiea gigantea]
MIEDNIDFSWSWDLDLLNVQDTIVQGSGIANYPDPWSTNNVDQDVSAWEPSVTYTINNDEAKPVAHNSITINGGPWSEDEHRLFLLGLKKHGKGKWKRISVEFVKTRLPSQVASHAQKYFKRMGNPAKKPRRRSSIFDIHITHVKIDDDQKKLVVQVNEATGAREAGYNVENQMDDCWISFEDNDLSSGPFYLNADVLQYPMEPPMVDHNNDTLGAQVTPPPPPTTTTPDVVSLTNEVIGSSCVVIDQQTEDYLLDLATFENLPTLCGVCLQSSSLG